MRPFLALTALVLSLAGASLAATPSKDVRVLGPFSVTAAACAATWDTVGHVCEVPIVTLPKGSLVLDFWAEIPAAFDGSGTHYTLDAGGNDLYQSSNLSLNTADTSTGNVVLGGSSDARRASLSYGAARNLLPGRTLAPVLIEACIWTEDAPPTTGVMNVYIEAA